MCKFTVPSMTTLMKKVGNFGKLVWSRCEVEMHQTGSTDRGVYAIAACTALAHRNVLSFTGKKCAHVAC